jgi:uncharacterized membrane protein YqjE
MTDVRSDEQLEDKSVGELVAIATASASRLIKSEIELAKLELKDDAKKAGLGATLFAVAGLIGGVVLILMSIAAAYFLVELGVRTSLAFVIVAVVYVLLAAILVGIGLWRMRKMSGARRTRRTVKEDLAILRRSGDSDDKPALTG